MEIEVGFTWPRSARGWCRVRSSAGGFRRPSPYVSRRSDSTFLWRDLDGRWEWARLAKRLSVIPAVGGYVWLLRFGSVAVSVAASVVVGSRGCDRFVSARCPAES